jgi:hypothetical protein
MAVLYLPSEMDCSLRIRVRFLSSPLIGSWTWMRELESLLVNAFLLNFRLMLRSSFEMNSNTFIEIGAPLSFIVDSISLYRGDFSDLC